jgi:hypothetical protein
MDAIGTHVLRQFGRYMSTASVTAYSPASHNGPALWHVVYEEDSDEEDLEGHELVAAAEAYVRAHSRDLDMLPVHFAWEFDGHELCGVRVLRNFGRSRVVGEVSAWLPACTHHGEPAVFAISYKDGMSTICLFV